MNEQNLKEEIVNLEARVQRLEKELHELEFLAPKPVITSEHIKQIGGFILGAIVLIGIFWM